MELTPKNVYVVDCDEVNNVYDNPKGHSYFRFGIDEGKPGLVFEHIYTCLKTGGFSLKMTYAAQQLFVKSNISFQGKLRD